MIRFFAVVLVLVVGFASGAQICLGGLFYTHTLSSAVVRGAPGEGRTAFRLGIKWVNEANIIPGYELVGYDLNTPTTATALNNTLNITQNPCFNNTPVVGVVGPPFSAHAGLAAVIGQIFKLITISPSATAPSLTDRATYPYFLRTTPADDGAAEAILNVVLRFNWTSVCVLATSDDYGDKASQTFRKLAQASNVTIQVNLLFPAMGAVIVQQKKTPDEYLSAIGGIFETLNPTEGQEERCFVNICFINGGLEFFTQAMVGVNRTGPEFMYIHADSATLQWEAQEMRTAGNLKNGTRPLYEYAKGWMGTSPFAGDAKTVPMRRILDDYWRKNTNSSTAAVENYYYDSGDGIPSTPSTVYAFDGVLAYAYAMAKIINQKKSVYDADLMNATLYTSNFSGASGTVSFDPLTGNRKGGLFLVYSFGTQEQGNTTTPKLVPIASTQSGDRSVAITDDEHLLWPSGKFGVVNQPLDHRVHDANVPQRFKTAIIAASAVGIFICIVGAVLVHINRKKDIIRLSSPVFNHIIILGCIFGFLNGIIYCIPGNSACMARPWLHSLSFTLVFGALFAKTHRAHRIFNNPQKGVAGLKDIDLLLRLLGILVIDAIPIIVWNAAWPLKDQVIIEEEPGLRTIGQFCNGEKSLELAFTSIAIKLLILVWGLYLAVQVRNVTMKDMNESRNITYSIYNIFFFTVINIILYRTIDNGVKNSYSKFIIITCSQWICFLIVIILLIGTKFFSLWFSNTTADEPSMDSMGVIRSRGVTRGSTSERDSSAAANPERLSSLKMPAGASPLARPSDAKSAEMQERLIQDLRSQLETERSRHRDTQDKLKRVNRDLEDAVRSKERAEAASSDNGKGKGKAVAIPGEVERRGSPVSPDRDIVSERNESPAEEAAAAAHEEISVVVENVVVDIGEAPPIILKKMPTLERDEQLEL